MERAWNGMLETELEELFQSRGLPKFRATQLFRFFHEQRGRKFSEITTFSKSLRAELENEPLRFLEVAHILCSQIDGTKKYLLRTQEGAVIEAVFMPYKDRNTLCISSQIGCKMGCAFCASTKAPFGRNLVAEEILDEVYCIEATEGARVDNIVLMGIGEPLDNYDEVLRFVRLITAKNGANLSARSITLSTCGLVPQIYRLSQEGIPINLAISLHSTTDAARQRTMPIARTYSIAEIAEASRQYFARTGRRVSYEYVLIAGENDTEDDLNRLAKLAQGAGFHVNLIPLNEIAEFNARAAEDQRLHIFQQALEKRGVHATVRQRRGIDINGACGQLRIEYEGSKN